jgi:hypothetical protein
MDGAFRFRERGCTGAYRLPMISFFRVDRVRVRVLEEEVLATASGISGNLWSGFE